MYYLKNGVLVDREIRELSKREHRPMIAPFMEGEDSAKGTLSSGLTSVGYDVRLGTKFKRVRSNHHTVIDPKNIPHDLFEDFEVESSYSEGHFTDGVRLTNPLYVPPNSYLLGVSYERFIIPPNVSAICIGKSTYARCGLFINTTPLEPGWEGHITIEIANLESVPVRIYPMEGIMQVTFHSRDLIPEKTYADRKGKYQAQAAEPVAPR